MPIIADTAICIRCWDFSETSQTVSLVTREHGVVRGLAKGAKREKEASHEIPHTNEVVDPELRTVAAGRTPGFRTDCKC